MQLSPIRANQQEDMKDVLHNIKLHMDNSPDLLALYERYFDRANSMTYGRNRAVFFFDKFVVKLPMNWGGVGDNDWEGSISNGPDAESCSWQVLFARTRLAYVNQYPIVFMERVEHAKYNDLRQLYGKVPDWVGCVDCGQVGFTRSGKLVAYDYGRN